MTGQASTDIRRDDLLLFAINILGLLWAGLAAALDWGVWSAYACVGLTSVLYIAHVHWTGHDLLERLLVFGLIAGLTELAADWWLVSITGTPVTSTITTCDSVAVTASSNRSRGVT